MAEPDLSPRQQLARITRRYLALAVIGWVVFVATVLFETLPGALMVGAFLLTLGAMLGLLVGARCPACRTGLVQAGVMAAVAPTNPANPRSCPRCGLRLDQAQTAR